MSSPLAMMLGYHTRHADDFDPLVDLAGLLYFTHTDDSTVTTGRVSAINDRLAGYTFTQGTTANRYFVSTTEKPGHTVWSQTSTARHFLSRSDATLAGQFNGAPAATVGAYVKMVNTGTVAEFLGHTNNTTSYDSFAGRFQVAVTNERWVLREQQSGVGAGTYIYDEVGSVPTSWALLAATTDGAGAVAFWSDGVLIGTASATHRSPVGLAHVVLGAALGAAGSPNYFIGGHFACLGQLSAASQIALSAWFADSFA